MTLPKIGFGTWQLKGDEALSSVAAALKTGYRLIDTAKIYGNEESVGQAIKNSNVPRDQLFVTTKLWQSDMGYTSAKEAFADSLDRLGLEYIDLYLIHWPGPSAEARKESWQALEEIQKGGLVKFIGVSNYNVADLDEMKAYANEMPYANQIEFHPFVYKEQKEIVEYCQRHNIHVEAYSPLAQAKNLKTPLLIEIANKYNATAAQVMLKWAMHFKTTPLPRSKNTSRIKQNFEMPDFVLTANEVEKISALSNGQSALG